MTGDCFRQMKRWLPGHEILFEQLSVGKSKIWLGNSGASERIELPESE